MANHIYINILGTWLYKVNDKRSKEKSAQRLPTVSSARDADCDRLLPEILHAGEDFINIAIVVWIEGEKKKGGHYGLVLIRASNMRVAELQKQAWQKLFDERFNIFYDTFKKERDGGRYLAD